MVRRLATNSLYVTGLLAWAAGCSAVLGIEDLGANPPLTEAGTGSGGGDNGGSANGGSGAGGGSNGGRTSAGGGVSAGGGTAGGGGEADGSVSDSSTGQAGAGGSGGKGGGGGGGTGGAGNGGTGGSGNGGGSGAGGSPSDAGTTVKGTVIDFWGHKVPDVIVSIGSTQTSTDANGAFTIDGVSGTYDVSLVVTYKVSGFNAPNGWLFQGLTRKDPTLQVYNGPQQRNGEANITVNGINFTTLPSTDVVDFTFASPDGYFESTMSSSAADFLSFYWNGGATTAGTGHGLHWTNDANGLPTAYHGYGSHALTLNETTAGAATLSLAPPSPAISVGNVSGTVTTTSTSRENAVYVRFLDGAAVRVVNDYKSTQANFSYLVPHLTDATIAVAAVDGDLDFYPPIAVAHKDELAAGQSGVALTIPANQSLLTPIDSATNVNANTSFTWSGPAGISVFTIQIDWANTYNQMFVVTTKKTVKLPSFPAASFSIASGTLCNWFVEEHGTATTMDEAAGPNGYLDQFAFHVPQGPRRTSGTYTETAHYSFTTQ